MNKPKTKKTKKDKTMADEDLETRVGKLEQELRELTELLDWHGIRKAAPTPDQAEGEGEPPEAA